MNAQLSPTNKMPAMGEYHVSNALLDDRAALEAAWERDGYWFFRGVLDLDAVSQLRRVYLDALKNLGVVDRAASDAIYNGNALGSLAGYPAEIDALLSKHVWQPFVRHPAIHAFFKRLLQDDPFWIPVVEYHTTPPNQDRNRNRFNYLHQDGFYNQGIPFKICWIPLAEIDETIGGLALTEGLHKGPCLHDLSKPPQFPIPPGAIPDSAWKRTTYRPGDLLVFDLNSPHSGLANYSDRAFRLSMDIRVMPASGNVPMIGKISALAPSSLEVRDDTGQQRRFVLDEDTYCRGNDGKKVPLADVPKKLHVGDAIIVASENGVAKVVRTPHG